MASITEDERSWCPAIELNETEKDLILKAEVPGVKIQELKIQAEARSVSIVGIHPKQKQQEQIELIPSQLHYGTLECKIPLPATVQVNRIAAELIAGVLTITMPKVQDTNPLTMVDA
jgi:HSP20 family protein